MSAVETPEVWAMRCGLGSTALCSVVALVSACVSPTRIDQSTSKADAGVALESKARVHARFAPNDSDFWRMALPSDLRNRDGSYDWRNWEARENAWVDMWLTALERRQLSWGVNAGMFVPLSGAIDPKSLPASGAASVEDDASVFLVDVDRESPGFGRRFPIVVTFNRKARTYAPPNLLSAVPEVGSVRAPNTTYALVVTGRVLDTNGNPLVAEDSFRAGLLGESDAHEELRVHFAPLRDAFGDLRIDAEDVAFATVFKTFEHHSVLERLSVWAETLDTEAALVFDPHSETDEYVAFEAHLSVPRIQSGTPPYEKWGEGLVSWDGDEPVVVERQAMPIVFTIPTHGPEPEQGWPLLFYLHGSGGNALQILDRGPSDEVTNAPAPKPGTGPAAWLASAGIAGVGFDFPLHGGRLDPPDTSGLKLYNLFSNIDATIDNFTVAAVELLLISRTFDELERAGGVIVPTDGDGDPQRIHVNPNAFLALGQSMGSTIGVPWASVDPRLDAVVWSGAGGLLSEIALSATAPLELKPVLGSLSGVPSDELDVHHPLMQILQNLWDLVEPVAYAPRVAASHTKHQLMLAGYVDRYFAPRAQAALSGALGLPLIEPTVEPQLPRLLSTFGVPLNAPVGTNAEGLTIGLVQHAAPDGLGHDVLFNQRAVQARVVCFLKGVATGQATIVASGAECEQ